MSPPLHATNKIKQTPKSLGNIPLYQISTLFHIQIRIWHSYNLSGLYLIPGIRFTWSIACISSKTDSQSNALYIWDLGLFKADMVIIWSINRAQLWVGMIRYQILPGFLGMSGSIWWIPSTQFCLNIRFHPFASPNSAHKVIENNIKWLIKYRSRFSPSS